MQVFIYEYFTGGGLCKFSRMDPASSLLSEATAMVRAVAEDFSSLQSVRVVTTRDGRLAEFHAAECEVVQIDQGQDDLKVIAGLAAKSDWTLLIAPETDGVLLERAQLVERHGGKLLSPCAQFIRIAADKQVTAEVMRLAGVQAPRGQIWSNVDGTDGVPFPAVIKPLDGCGSQNVRLLTDAEQMIGVSMGRWRIEEYIAGVAASVSVLCGPERNWPLASCEQLLSEDGRLSYAGGRLPLTPEFNDRARRLALRAVEALPPTSGYVGVDLVLGSAADGSGDFVIEVNPRLTSSYVGLRAASGTNLAAAMLAVAGGGEPILSFRSEPVKFTAAGEIEG